MRKSGKICEHTWNLSDWDARYEICEQCRIARLTVEEWNRRNNIAEKRFAKLEAQRQAAAK